MAFLSQFSAILLAAVASWAVGPEPVFAYGGPGSVISGIGAFLAAIAALLAALFGFVWYPLKRLYRKMTKKEETPTEETPAPASRE